MRSQQQATQQLQSGPRRCDICSCNVSGGPKAWLVHTEGIRHRRNSASCEVFGEPGHNVISTFEHYDGPPPARYKGKDAVLLSAAATIAAGDAHGLAGGIQHTQQLQQLQVQLRKHLANQVGVSNIYHRAVERFTMDALAAAWRFLEESIKQQLQEAAAPLPSPKNSQHHQQQQQQQDPSAEQQQPATDPYNLQQPHQQGNPSAAEQTAPQPDSPPPCKLQLSLHEPHQIACLGEVLPEKVHSLELSVPFQTYGPAAAATSAAVATFLSCLSHRHHLHELSLRFTCDDFSSILRQGGGGMARLPDLWGKVAGVLTQAMKVNCGLQKLTIASYPGQFPPDELAALQVTLATARQQLRAAVLLSTHSRVGNGSMLHHLPHEVMVMLVELAVPKACMLWLELPQGLDGDSSSSSSGVDYISSSDYGIDASSSEYPGNSSSDGDDDDEE